MKYKNIDINNANLYLKNRINDFLNEHGWTLRHLAAQSDIPYGTLKKLASAKIENPSLTTLLKLAETFHCSIDSLIGRESPMLEKLSTLPQRALTIIEALTDLEISLAFSPDHSLREYIPLFIPTGNLRDGMYLDSAQIDVIDIAPYRSIYGEKLMCGLCITTNALYPVYLEGDVLLLGRDRPPLFGETAVFIHQGRIHIRTLKPGNPPRLVPVNGLGIPLSFQHPEEYQVFGYVLTLYRGVYRS